MTRPTTTGPCVADPTLVNTSFRMQRITGQQRYATEIASRLLDRAGFREITPRGWWAGSSLRVWAWVLAVLEVRARGRRLLSLTARAPYFHRGQVLVVHDLFVLTHPEWFSRAYVLSHAPLLRAQLKRATALIAVSQPVADELRPLFAGPIVVAPNAPSTVFRRRDEGVEVLDARGLRPRGYLLAVGSLDPRKNLPLLAEAYGALSEQERAEFPLTVVGGGAAVFRDETISWPSGVVDVGYVTDEELGVLYANARAVVFPSLAEGFGLPLVEAAAAGSAAVAISDIPVFRWVCGDGAIYFDPTSVASVTAGLRRAMTEAVPITIDLDRFDWDRSADVVARLCDELAGLPPERELPEQGPRDGVHHA